MRVSADPTAHRLPTRYTGRVSDQHSSTEVVVVGAGMAGSECAWQLAERGIRVRLIEQKPLRRRHSPGSGRALHV